MNGNLTFDQQEQLLINFLKKNIGDVFNDSFKNIDDSSDAISFAYGWLMLAYSMEYNTIYSKLTHLNDYYRNNSNKVKDFSFIIEPLTNIVQLLNLNEKILSTCGAITINSKNKSLIEKSLYENFDLFLIEFYKKKRSFEPLSFNEQKLTIFKLIDLITCH